MKNPWMSWCRTTGRNFRLVVEMYDGYYRSAACLTLDMAYDNARLIARPDLDWLQPWLDGQANRKCDRYFQVL